MLRPRSRFYDFFLFFLVPLKFRGFTLIRVVPIGDCDCFPRKIPRSEKFAVRFIGFSSENGFRVRVCCGNRAFVC